MYADRISFSRMDHNKQSYQNFREIQFQTELYNRSIFALIHVYNDLIQQTMDYNIIAAFRSYLTHVTKSKCQTDDSKWLYYYNTRTRNNTHQVRRSRVIVFLS